MLHKIMVKSHHEVKCVNLNFLSVQFCTLSGKKSFKKLQFRLWSIKGTVYIWP